jgi:response regulator RpfG family c-di-GMP phosphodiesterase
MNNTLFRLYSVQGIVVLERLSDGRFRLLTDASPVLCDLMQRNCKVEDVINVREISPFLENFFIDAEEHWAARIPEPLSSGPWIETSKNGIEIALQADAVCLDDQSLLLFREMRDAYHQQVRILQAARQNLLASEQLEIEIHKRTEQIRLREEEVAMRLLAASGVRDEETGAHVRRIGLYSAVIAQALGWHQLAIDDIRVAAPMHDIGKIGIPDKILLKPGRLTTEEYKIMQGHAEIGARMLDGSDIPLLVMARDIAHCHHEHWDGCGYPNNLKGTDIPESARIVAIADVYDALVHERIYKSAFTESHAIELMRAQSGNYFDPDIFRVFLTILPEIREIREEIREDDYPSPAENLTGQGRA